MVSGFLAFPKMALKKQRKAQVEQNRTEHTLSEVAEEGVVTSSCRGGALLGLRPPGRRHGGSSYSSLGLSLLFGRED